MTATDPSPFALDMPAPQVREHPAKVLAGLPVLVLAIALSLAGGYPIYLLTIGTAPLWPLVASAVAFLAAGLLYAGLTVVAPREARVIQFLGAYVGTVREPGLRFVNPFTTRRKVSTRIRNHETTVSKVNDADGNPIEIAAVVVWQVEDTARAVFEVDDFVQFVTVQAETAVRQIATSYPYDAREDGLLSLRDSAEGAVGMVEMALERLEQRGVVELDDERRAAMVSNLLVVLCGTQATQPVVNTGTLYS